MQAHWDVDVSATGMRSAESLGQPTQNIFDSLDLVTLSTPTHVPLLKEAIALTVQCAMWKVVSTELDSWVLRGLTSSSDTSTN
eukprot:285080-Amphidinium_carterae.1